MKSNKFFTEKITQQLFYIFFKGCNNFILRESLGCQLIELEKAIAIQDELVQRCLNREAGSYRALYDRYSKAMYNSALRIVGRGEDAEDVLQEAFVEVFTHLDRFRGTSTVGAWIKRIVVNKSISHLRKKKIQYELVEDTLVHEIEDPLDSESQIDLWQVDRIRTGMNALAPGYRTVLTLHLMEGYDHQEIAEILGVAESTVRTQYIRAKKKLRSILQE